MNRWLFLLRTLFIRVYADIIWKTTSVGCIAKWPFQTGRVKKLFDLGCRGSSGQVPQCDFQESAK